MEKELQAKAELVRFTLASLSMPRSPATIQALRAHIAAVDDSKFLARCTLYTRTMAGLRWLPNIMAIEIMPKLRGAEWSKFFFRTMAVTVDDVVDILSYWLARKGKPIPNALKKGLGLALGKFNVTELSQVKKPGKGKIKLIDAINLIHPPKTKAIVCYIAEDYPDPPEPQDGENREANILGVARLLEMRSDSLISEVNKIQL